MLTKRVHWRDHDVRLLLKVWDRHIAQLRLNKRNKHVYAEMEVEMQKKNLNFSAEEIRTKIKNLTKRFRSEQKSIAAGTAHTDEWQFFKPINNVLSQFSSVSGVIKEDDQVSDDLYEDDNCYPLDVDVTIKSEPEDSVSCNSEQPDRRLSSDIQETAGFQQFGMSVPFSSGDRSTQSFHLKPPMKRKMDDIHEEILLEMKRANRIADENQRATNRLLQQTNDIAERNLAIYKDFFDFIKNKLR